MSLKEEIEREFKKRQKMKSIIIKKSKKNGKGSDLLFWHNQFYLSFRHRMGEQRAAKLAYSEIFTIIKSFERLKADVEGTKDD